MSEILRVPIVVIGASVLALEIIEQLIRKKNHVVVIDKLHKEGPPPNAVLRNQHTLQSGLLHAQTISTTIISEQTYLQRGYLRMASSYKKLLGKYESLGLISPNESYLEIEEDIPVVGSPPLTDQYIKKVKFLGFGEKYREVLINDDRKEAIERIGDFAVEISDKKSFFRLPDKGIDYDKLLKVKKNEIVVKSNEGPGKALFLPKSKKVGIVLRDDLFSIQTDEVELLSEFVFIAAGSGVDELLSKIGGDGSTVHGYSLLKTKEGNKCNTNVSTFAKYKEKDRGLGKRRDKKFLFIASHGKESVNNTSFLVIGNAKSHLLKSSTHKSSIKKLEDALEQDLANALGEPLVDMKQITDRFSFCKLRSDRQRYFPNIFQSPSNPKLISGHSGLTSTAQEVAKDMIKRLSKSNNLKSIRNRKIVNKERLRELEALIWPEKKSIRDEGTMIRIHRSQEITDKNTDSGNGKKSWFRGIKQLKKGKS